MDGLIIGLVVVVVDGDKGDRESKEGEGEGERDRGAHRHGWRRGCREDVNKGKRRQWTNRVDG